MSSRQAIGWGGALGFCAALLSSGCGSKVETGSLAQDSLQELPLAKGGARLRARAYGVGGAKQFISMFDRQSGLDCAFATNAAGDGVRCFPTRVSEEIYLDAACTEPAVFLTGSAAVGDWLTFGESVSACPGAPLPTRRAFEIGEQIYGSIIHGEPGAPSVYARTEAGCSVTEGEPKSAWPVNRVLPLAEDEFVAGHVESVDVGSGFRLQRVIADDGTQLTIGVTNESDVACTPQATGQCVPGPVAIAQGSPALDAGCTQPSYASPLPAECGAPQYGLVDGPSPGVFDLEPLSRGFSKDLRLPLPDSPSDYTYDCNAADLPDGYFSPGRPASGFPVASWVKRGAGAAHTKVFGLGTDAALITLQSPASPGLLFDAQDQPCVVTPAIDGSLRCVTDAISAREAGYYEDAACTQRLYFEAGLDAQPIVPADLEALRVNGWDESAGKLSTLHSLRRFEGTFYMWMYQTCQPAPQDAEPWLAIDQPVAIDSLPLVTETEL